MRHRADKDEDRLRFSFFGGAISHVLESHALHDLLTGHLHHLGAGENLNVRSARYLIDQILRHLQTQGLTANDHRHALDVLAEGIDNVNQNAKPELVDLCTQIMSQLGLGEEAVRVLEERELFDEYLNAFEIAITKTASERSPWYIIPADDKYNMRLLTAKILCERLNNLDMHFPVSSKERQKELKKFIEIIEDQNN